MVSILMSYIDDNLLISPLSGSLSLTPGSSAALNASTVSLHVEGLLSNSLRVLLNICHINHNDILGDLTLQSAQLALSSSSTLPFSGCVRISSDSAIVVNVSLVANDTHQSVPIFYNLNR